MRTIFNEGARDLKHRMFTFGELSDHVDVYLNGLDFISLIAKVSTTTISNKFRQDHQKGPIKF